MFFFFFLRFKWFASAGKRFMMPPLNSFLEDLQQTLQWNMKWGLFVLTDMPVVTLSWLGPTIKTSLQNVRGRLFPGACALWPLTPAPPLHPPPVTAVEVFVLGDENGAARLFCVTASTSAEWELLGVFKKASHDQSSPCRKHTGVNLRAASCVCVCVASLTYSFYNTSTEMPVSNWRGR